MAILEPLRQHLSTRLLGAAEPDEVGLSAERLARLSAVFQREIDRKRLPGVVALVARRGKIAYCESLGVRDPASGASMPDDATEGGSVTELPDFRAFFASAFLFCCLAIRRPDAPSGAPADRPRAASA